MTLQYALIVGSGFDAFETAADIRQIETRFGAPSAPVRVVEFGGTGVFVLARHGDDHSLPPHLVNYRANLQALKDLGASAVVALNTVGAVTAIGDGGEIAVPDQILDYTWGREHTIYGQPTPGFDHIEFTDPLSAWLCNDLIAAAKAANVDCHDGGVYAATQGPRLETAAEIDRLERDGADYVGMTGMPEAGLARELGLDYAMLSLIVNRAAGRGDKPIHDDVEACTLAARGKAFAVLDKLFGTGP